MHVFLMVEGHSAAIRRFEQDFDRRQYPGKGIGGETAVVKLGEVKFYDVRFASTAREEVLADLKGIGFRPIEEWKGHQHGKVKLAFLFDWIRRLIGWFGIKSVKDWKAIPDRNLQHGLNPPETGPWRIGAGGYCMWKVVIGELDDKKIDGVEQI